MQNDETGKPVETFFRSEMDDSTGVSKVERAGDSVVNLADGEERERGVKVGASMALDVAGSHAFCIL